VNSSNFELASGWRSMLFWRKTISGFAPRAAHLTAQHVEILGAVKLADLHVVFGRKLALKRSSRALENVPGPAFVAVRESMTRPPVNSTCPRRR